MHENNYLLFKVYRINVVSFQTRKKKKSHKNDNNEVYNGCYFENPSIQ